MRTVIYSYNIFTFTDYRIALRERADGHEIFVKVIEESAPDTPELAKHRKLVAKKFEIED